MNSIDEPFADSSAFNFYLLSKFTRKHVKVALSEDGADELFKGYNKHRALELVKSSFFKIGIQSASAIAGNLKGSRDGKLNNKLRQLKKLNQLAKLSDIEKQKFLATISEENYCNEIILKKNNSKYFDSLFSLNFAFQNFYIDDAFDFSDSRYWAFSGSDREERKALRFALLFMCERFLFCFRVSWWNFIFSFHFLDC